MHGMYVKLVSVIRLRRMGWAGYVVCMGKGGMHADLAGKLAGKRPFGKHGHRWEVNSKMDLQGKRMGSVDWICLAEDRKR